MAGKKEINTVYIGKGIGILLVALGHYLPGQAPEYWLDIRRVIYKFHMPLFFALSGYLLGARAFHIGSVNGYLVFIKSKVRRLIYPFLSIALIFSVIKYFSGLFVRLQSPLSLSSVVEVFVNPVQSYMPLLWFIYVLFLMYTVFPVLKAVFRLDLLVFIFVLVLANLSWPKIFCVAPLFANLPYFVLGYILARNVNLDEIKLSTNIAAMSACLCAFLLVYLPGPGTQLQSGYPKTAALILGFAGVAVCINVSSLLNSFGNSAVSTAFKYLGVYSVSIYLFHTFFVSTVRVVFFQVFRAGSAYFLPSAFLAVAAGLVFPLLLEKYVLTRHPLPRKYILGCPPA